MPTPRLPALLALATLLAGCATVPPGTYFPGLSDPDTQKVSHALYRAAQAAGDDPARYSFALVMSQEAQAYSDRDATFYVTDGLARLPVPVVEAALAHEVAHEVLKHAEKRRRVWFSMSAGFAALGLAVPGAGFANLLVNPLVARAYSLKQQKQADAKAVEILRAMGYATPRRALATALRTIATFNKGARSTGSLLSPRLPLAERLAALEPPKPTSRLTRASPHRMP
ncbi:MAG: M48 family metalloprotease [Candidatus Methylomirabilia bacterium]